MYEQFYGMREAPFLLSPDPAYLYIGTRHRHALTMLEYALAQASSFALITGEVGCGKTTVVHYLLDRASPSLNIGFLSNTHGSIGSLLPWVMATLGINPAAASDAELYCRFMARIEEDYRSGRRAVIVIDEAQNLSVAALEQLRVLSNLNLGKRVLLQTILVGQPEIRTTLARADLRQFAQRIAIDYHLEALEAADVHAYVHHRLAVAGAPSSLFTPGAIELVHKATGGVPRLVNIICDTSLVYGFADRKASIGAEVVEMVLRDRANAVLPLQELARTAPAPAFAIQ